MIEVASDGNDPSLDSGYFCAKGSEMLALRLSSTNRQLSPTEKLLHSALKLERSGGMRSVERFEFLVDVSENQSGF